MKKYTIYTIALVLIEQLGCRQDLVPPVATALHKRPFIMDFLNIKIIRC